MSEQVLDPAMIKGRDFFSRVARHDRQFFHEYYVDRKRKVVYHQAEIFDFIDKVAKTTKRGVLIEPRDHTKSTIAAHSFIAQEVAKNPDIRILLAQKTQKEANKTVGQVSDTLRDEQLKEDFRIGFRRIQANSFTLHRSKIMKEATLEGVGVGGAITGGHFDIIVLDDVVDVKNSRTPGERQALKDWFYGTLSLLVEPHTIIIYIATRKHFDDLTGELMRNPAWATLERKAIIKMPENIKYLEDENGNVYDVTFTGDFQVLFPEKWSIKALLLLKQQLGSIVFNREMMNEVLSEEDARLKASWLRYYRFDDEPPAENREMFPRLWRKRYSGVDLAISLSKSADYFVLLSVVVDQHNRIFVEPFTRGRFEFPEQATIIKAHVMEKKPWRCVVESNQYQLGLSQHLNREMLRPVTPVKHTSNKEERIIGTLSPLFEAGKIFIHESMFALIDEYTQFGKAQHDDVMDALEMAVSAALEHQGRPTGIKQRMRFLG